MANEPPSFSRTLGLFAVAFGLGLVGAYVFDYHGHTCTACGNRWHHLGYFNQGSESSHQCPACGTVQWWQDGEAERIGEITGLPPGGGG